MRARTQTVTCSAARGYNSREAVSGGDDRGGGGVGMKNVSAHFCNLLHVACDFRFGFKHTHTFIHLLFYLVVSRRALLSQGIQ